MVLVVVLYFLCPLHHVSLIFKEFITLGAVSSVAPLECAVAGAPINMPAKIQQLASGHSTISSLLHTHTAL